MDTNYEFINAILNHNSASNNEVWFRALELFGWLIHFDASMNSDQEAEICCQPANLSKRP